MYRRFYYPDRIEYETPADYELAFEPVYFRSADGTRLSGWFIPTTEAPSAREAKGTAVHMHGNAQNMSTHWAFAEWLLARGYNLFEFDYRSYGKSDNVQPEPKGVFEDAVAALDYIRSRQDIDTDKLFVFGQSLGGMLAIAATAASPKGVRALVAEAPFYNYSELADDRRLGDGEWMDNTYTAGAYIKQLSVPLLLIHGTHDSIVHLSHSERILAEAPGSKRLEIIQYGRHTDAMTDRHGGGYQDIVARFLETQKP